MTRKTSAVYIVGGLLGLLAATTFLPDHWAAAQVSPIHHGRARPGVLQGPDVVTVATTGPGGLIDQAAGSDAQIYVDDSFPAVDAMRVALRFESQHQSQLAIQKYQDVVDLYGQKLIVAENDSYISITDYVRQRLLAMPSVQKGLYDQTFGPQAKKLIDAAIAQRDPAALLRVCDRYFPSTAAVQGLSRKGRRVVF